MELTRRCFRTGFIGLAALMVLAGQARAEPGVFLSWQAPYGQPRAQERLLVPCDGTSRPDTLYLTYLTGKDSRFYIGLDAAVRIRPLPGDTLPSFWWVDRPEGAGHIVVEFPGDSVAGAMRPFRHSHGFGGSFPERGSEGLMMRLVHVLPISQPVAVRDSTQYLLARMIFTRPGSRRDCERPLCIEWATAEFGLDSTAVTRSTGRGQRFTTWNSRKGIACDSLETIRTAPAGNAPK